MLPRLRSHPFLDALATRVLVLDGAMGTSLQDRDLDADDFGGEELEGCNEVLVATRPDVVTDVHRSFLDVGVDAVQTDTFGGAPWVLDEYGLGARTEELNARAAELARTACGEVTDRPTWVVGAVGPGTRSPTLSLSIDRDGPDGGQWIDLPTMTAGYARQVRGLLDGGVDVLLVETCFDLLQVKAAVAACDDVFAERGARIPLLVQFTVEADINTMLLGTEPLAAIAALDPLPIDVLGMNCATGPADMREHVRTLARSSRLPISVVPNAGIPELVDGATVYPLGPAGLAAAQAEFVTEHGVRLVGGCCGTTPEHLAAVVDAVRMVAPRRRVLADPAHVRPSAPYLAADAQPTAPTDDRTGDRTGNATNDAPGKPLVVDFEPALASLYSAQPLDQDVSFLVIGERANANGSRAFRELLLAEDWEGAVEVVREQTRGGAHALDVCVDYVGRDGVADMVEAVSRFATRSTLPLVVDSTELDVVEAALTRLGARAVINSVNLEDGRGKADRLLALARRYGAAVIVLAIDEEGQARTADRKVEICTRIAALAVDEHGLEPHDLVFDCLTFPLGSGQEDLRGDGLATLEAIERVRAAIPGCHTTLGVSNISFGLSSGARQVLNSVFLQLAVERGLDTAIVHPGKILPLHRIPDEHVQIATDLVLDRRGTRGRGGDADAGYDPLHALMAAFEGVDAAADTGPQLDELPLEERLRRRIVDGVADGMTADLDQALSGGRPALSIIDDLLLDGMREVGELFGAGKLQLPFVLQSAEAMKGAVAHLEPHIERGASSQKGTVVLATVKGDVHDIGKNLVDIILRNNGWRTVNLGIKQPLDSMLAALDEHGADAIGMSGLLVKSTVVMRDNLTEMNARGVAPPVLLGGAALTRSYVEDDLRRTYDGEVFYCKDAFEGLSVLDRVISARARGEQVEPAGVVPRRTTTRTPRPSEPPRRDAAGRPRSDVADDVPVPTPPFWGTRVVRGISVDEIAPLLNEVALFRNQWGLSPGDRSPQEYATFLDHEARPALRDWLDRAKREKVITPQVVYGYLPANGDGDDVVVWDPDAPGEVELARWSFPRQPRGRFLCIADFLRPVSSGELDVLGAQCVTVGPRISEVAAELFSDDAYVAYLHAHGFGVEMAEALAEAWHRRIREELGIADEDADTPQEWFRQGYRGSRYSFGYAACPDLSLQHDLDRVLRFDRIGIEVTEEDMLAPEQSTSAIVLHHPEARYFSAGKADDDTR